MHTVEEATEILLNKVSFHPGTEVIPTSQALHRKIPNDILAPFDQPGFRRAAMDGFAILVEDSYGASETNPRQLKISGTVEIGDLESPSILPGQAIRISTGAPLPDGANGVIKIEDCELLDEIVEIYAAIPEGKNIAAANEDVKKGQIILKKGTVLQPWDVGILESLAFDNIEVYQRPRVASISTGNELIASGQTPSRGQVVDSNRPAVNSWLKFMGAELVFSEQSNDNPSVIKESLKKVSPKVDLIVTTGGTSVGTKDYMAEVINELGELWVHGIAMRPGKPVALGMISHEKGSTPIISLPGYPLAAYLNFHLFVSFLLHRWTGNREILDRRISVKLSQKVPSKVGVHDFVRLRKGKDGAELIRITGAGILSSIVHADYLLEVPTNLEGYNSGDEVTVYLLR